MGKKLLSSEVKISSKNAFLNFFYLSIFTVLKIIHFLKNWKISFWQCTACTVQFSAEIWRWSEQNQALGNFSNLDSIITARRRERVKNACCQLFIVRLLYDLLFNFCSVFSFDEILCSIGFYYSFSCLPSKYSVLILDCIPGILIPTTTIIKRVNRHHTSDCTVFVLV
jgi:hypothetical protein